eukprot:4893191-Prymnesium_polylepis.3
MIANFVYWSPLCLPSGHGSFAPVMAWVMAVMAWVHCTRMGTASERAHRHLQCLLALQSFFPQNFRCLNVPKSFEAHRLNVRTFKNIAVRLHGARFYPSAIRYPVAMGGLVTSQCINFICDQSMSVSDSEAVHPPAPSGNE